MKPISWLFDVVRVLDSGTTTIDVPATEADGVTRFIASTDTEDRAMDVVNQNWNLASFHANAPILDNHNPHRVVGVGTRAEVVNGKLEIDVRWDDDNPDDSIKSVGHQHRKGIRRAGSVGFRAGQVIERDKLPKDHKHYRTPVKIETAYGDFMHAGLFYDRPELLEFSSATVPMNPEALQRGLFARAAERSPIDELIAWLERATPDQLARINAALIAKTSNPDEDFAAGVLRLLKGKKT